MNGMIDKTSQHSKFVTQINQKTAPNTRLVKRPRHNAIPETTATESYESDHNSDVDSGDESYSSIDQSFDSSSDQIDSNMGTTRHL